jgi:DNA-binding NarL/FixJ family response regulator
MVVEDFAPFCQFICKTPAKYPSFQIICEVSGGAGTVQKATEPKPDLILLDIGHPTLNGIAAARQSSKLAARDPKYSSLARSLLLTLCRKGSTPGRRAMS